MKKILSGLLILILFTGCWPQSQTDNGLKNNADSFSVYLKDSNEEIFSEEDLLSYDPETHTFTFTPQGAEKMKSYQLTAQVDTGLYQKSFKVRVGSEEVYEGKFWTALSSLSEPGIVMTDVMMVGPEQNTLTLSLGYPGEELSSQNGSLLDDPRIVDYFRSVNKLK